MLQNDQPAEPIVLPPFSGNLREDGGQKLSNQYLQQSIEKPFHTIKKILNQVQRKPAFTTTHLPAQCASKENWDNRCGYFFKSKCITITPLSQLTAKPAFPTPYELAQFAYETYEDYKVGETDAQYETRLALPDGWKLLTTASNCSNTNGYFGAAYWHPEHQHVVISHRGTTNLGAMWADVKGVMHNKYVGQMESASTFAHKVVEVLREVKRKHRLSFQLFFTGHSLGGWLAQITTFTTEYLKIDSNIFHKSNNVLDCFHPHTVVFDSPGCKDMLLEMKDSFDVRLEGRSIDIEHLDITSYLSAPNRINTLNTHVGTVYRIFPDLSDMGLLEKSTPLYTVATHSMNKIVQAFDPETGQVRKHEKGQLEVQVVVDWPISAGLSGGEEYNKLFEWAKHLNNYHPDIKDVSFQQLCLIRYQTKIYDERVNSLSVFSQEEKEFLQCYLTLRECPKSFKLKELFTVVKDNQAQEEAEKILQNFEIKENTIICKDYFELKVLVPYVKRLLQLFPEIREIGNRFFQCETNSCIEQIKQSPLDFNPYAMRLMGFLEDVHQQVLQLEIVDGDEWAGLIKVYQVLNITDRLTEGQYTVLKLERLLTLNMLMDFRTLMQSIKAPHLILVACEANQLLKTETKDMIRTFFATMKQNPFIKVILTTGSGVEALHFLQQIGWEIFGNGFVTRHEQLTWSDLTASSRKKLLEKSVKFQGANLYLNKLMSVESPVAGLLPLGALLKEKELTIADPVPISNGYNESYYIGRTFRYQKTIKQDIFNDNDVRDSLVYLANTKEEYKKSVC
jgi:hypothetical protein